ncbi:ester hydrolase C11orf54 homolog [Ooceraea biroi]|uniref:ester hydrolase C11orf54 homolog n=1 Tax=Ooceraea biroi TaxID=2015173 RepID=UPI000F083ADA|nr:ester hydrolase C11orf54 homolog [Ooceraea biroi]
MAAVPETDHYQIRTIDLHVPDPTTITNVLTHALSMNFSEVAVECIDCPDLRQYRLVAPGLCGNPAILEIGSLSYLFPQPRLDKKYYFKNILRQLNLTSQDNFIIGAGNHSYPPNYDHSEVRIPLSSFHLSIVTKHIS